MKVSVRKKSLLTLLAAAFCVYIMVHDVVQRVDVYGPSMEPAYREGDVILANKLAVLFGRIERFDVVVFRYQYRDHQFYLKRVIGLPGETVQIMDGAVYIDGRLLEGDYATEPMEHPRRATEPVKLGPEEYFLLGDNRNDSSDSRDSDIGNVSRSQIIGKAGLWIWKDSKE